MDLNLKIPTTLSEASYSGSLGCSDFFIGQLINKREIFWQSKFEWENKWSRTYYE